MIHLGLEIYLPEDQREPKNAAHDVYHSWARTTPTLPRFVKGSDAAPLLPIGNYASRVLMTSGRRSSFYRRKLGLTKEYRISNLLSRGGQY